MNLHLARRVALDAVTRACHLCRHVQALSGAESISKEDRSPVTVADFGAQAVASHLLASSFPDIPLVGEESSDTLRHPDSAPIRDKVVAAVREILPDLPPARILDAIDRGGARGGDRGLFWTIDPIDGTKGFLRGDQYAVALALVEDGEVRLGVLGCPELLWDDDTPDSKRGCLFVSIPGQGTSQYSLDGDEEVPVAVSSSADLQHARICESVEKAHTSQSDSARVAALLGIQASPYRIDSQCKYAAVARGDASIYLRLPSRNDYVEKIWDHAAGWAVVTGAGGTVTDITGAPLNFGMGRRLERNRGVVVTNGALHEPVLEAVQQVLGLTPAR